MNPVPGKCTECGDESLSITPTAINHSGVVDGRLQMHDISVVFVVGCDNCSHTVGVLNEGSVSIQIKPKDKT